MNTLLPFLLGHATHPDWRMALALAAAQIDAGLASRSTPAAQSGATPPPAAAPTLGLVYFTDHYVDEAEELLAELRLRWPGVAWVGSVGVGIAVNGVEYFDQPALALLMGELPRALFRVFSGEQALPRPAQFSAYSALVHADGRTDDLPELLVELAERTDSGYLFGGLASARGQAVTLANGVYQGGISGVAFAPEVQLVSRVTQGCTPVGPTRRVTRSERNLVLELDGRAALDCLVEDLGIDLNQPRVAMTRLRATLAGIADASQDMLARRGQFGADTRVRHLLGLDPARRGVALSELIEAGQQIAFCRRDTEAARRDLIRICSEIREELDPVEEESLSGAALLDLGATLRGLGARFGAAPGAATSAGGAAGPAEQRQSAAAPGESQTVPMPLDSAPARPEDQVAAAIYISCSGRGGPHFGAPSAELQIVQRALGDVPLIGFFAGGEIARHHLYGYTGVLTVLRTELGEQLPRHPPGDAPAAPGAAPSRWTH
jgi:small ligand-binding sensory domain FIST